MAKRFTDTDKWKDDWFLRLDNDYRMIWLWLLDNCDHAGFCKRSINLVNMMCRTNITEDDLLAKMEGRILIHQDYWFIPKFIKFQYPTLLSNKPAVKSVVKELFKRCATRIVPESFGNSYLIVSESFDNHCLMIKDKDKDKDKDKGYGLLEDNNENTNNTGTPKFKTDGLGFIIAPSGERLYRHIDDLAKDIGAAERIKKYVVDQHPHLIQYGQNVVTVLHDYASRFISWKMSEEQVPGVTELQIMHGMNRFIMNDKAKKK